jgi:hypothetical protein
MPMHPLQPAWWIRAPARTSADRKPPSMRVSSICREVAFTSNETPAATWRPATMSAGTAKSRRPGLAEEPTYAW